jgi:hypothetical protein
MVLDHQLTSNAELKELLSDFKKYVDSDRTRRNQITHVHGYDDTKLAFLSGAHFLIDQGYTHFSHSTKKQTDDYVAARKKEMLVYNNGVLDHIEKLLNAITPIYSIVRPQME